MKRNGPVGIGFLGAGGFARSHGRAAAASGVVRIESVYDPARGNAEAFVKEFGGRRVSSREEVLSDPAVEAVVAAVPNHVHEEVVTACARAGKPVLVEKPLANTVAEGKRMIDECRSAGVLLAVGHNTRRTAGARKLKGLVGSGELGTVVMFEGNFSHPGARRLAPGMWRAKRESCPGGPLNLLGVHVLDTVIDLFGPCESVTAMVRHAAAEVDMDDTALVLMRMENGVTGYVGGNYVCPPTRYIRVLGTEANVDIGGAFVLHRSGSDPETLDLEETDTLREELEEFARASRGEGTYEVPGEVALQSVAVLEAALRSAAEGRLVRISEVLQGAPGGTLPAPGPCR